MTEGFRFVFRPQVGRMVPVEVFGEPVGGVARFIGRLQLDAERDEPALLRMMIRRAGTRVLDGTPVARAVDEE
jgi:hypothetical protein